MFNDLDPRSSDTRNREAPDPRDAQSLDPRDVLTRDLDLPRGLERERVHLPEHGQDYHLRRSEVRALATIGVFRVVAADDLRDDQGRPGDVRHGDLERLRSAGLIRAVAPLDRDDRTVIVTLTERGREVLETHRSRGAATRQTFYAGAVKSRELSHDAQLYRAYLRAAERLRAQGARLERVVLDDELKRDYQRFLQARNRDRSDSDGRPDRSREEINQWAIEHDLPVVNDHVQFPDVRIEYERSDGRREVDNVEVMTAHYRGMHASGKVAAGFTRFRGSTGLVGGPSAEGASSPFDPHAAEELLR
jgi:DNA-binding MarR family transcriptional regulator